MKWIFEHGNFSEYAICFKRERASHIDGLHRIIIPFNGKLFVDESGVTCKKDLV